MKKLTKQDARFVVAQIFRDGFHIGVVRHRFGPQTKVIYFSPADQPFVAYPLAYATTWEEALDIARSKFTVRTA